MEEGDKRGQGDAMSSNRRTQPTVAGFDDGGRRPGARECRSL